MGLPILQIAAQYLEAIKNANVSSVSTIEKVTSRTRESVGELVEPKASRSSRRGVAWAEAVEPSQRRGSQAKAEEVEPKIR